jgi:hypothetical protein
MRIDSALSTSAKFGTRAQPGLFFPLGFQPSRVVANEAVTFCSRLVSSGWYPPGWYPYHGQRPHRSERHQARP